MEGLAQAALGLWGLPEAASARAFVLQLSGISGGYWMLCFILGHWAEAAHRRLAGELADLFVIAYHIVLAVAYAMVMALPAFVYGDGSFWRKAAAFVLVYAVLKGVYADDGEADEHSVWGLVLGIVAFLSFAVFREPLRNPVTEGIYRVAAELAASWVGALMSVFAGYRLIRLLARWVYRKLTWKPRLRTG